MAGRLGISVSYLSQIENNDRPITDIVLVALSREFPLEAFGDVDESASLLRTIDAATDAGVPAERMGEADVRRGIEQQPLLAKRMVALHEAWRRSQEQLRVLDDRYDSGSTDAAPLPWRSELSRFDPRARRLAVNSALPPESRAFLLAHRLVRYEFENEMRQVVEDSGLASPASRELLSIGLANYAAGALLMPYGAFRDTAREVRHDIDRAALLFCRVDMAGNVTKRHSATRLQFAALGGACPLWMVHEAVAIPDRILVQHAEMPDGTRYVSMAKGERLLAHLGDKRVMLLRNHGILVMGRTVPEAFIKHWSLQRACEIQIATASMGAPITVPDEVVAVHQRDLHMAQVPGGPGAADFAAMHVIAIVAHRRPLPRPRQRDHQRQEMLLARMGETGVGSLSQAATRAARLAGSGDSWTSGISAPGTATIIGMKTP
eukprot:tig00001467_g8772.t1